MSNSLGIVDRKTIDSFFNKGGNVLNFNSNDFQEFVYEAVGINIFSDKYCSQYGSSKGKSLKGFFKVAPDDLCIKLLIKLIKYAENIELEVPFQIKEIVNILSGRNVFETDKKSTNKIDTEDAFLRKIFENSDAVVAKLTKKLNLESIVCDEIKSRIQEIKTCLEHGANLSCIVLCGSVLEVILQTIAHQYLDEFHNTNSFPQNSSSKKYIDVDKLNLSQLIKISAELKILDKAIEHYSHGLREFRNYIHPSVFYKSNAGNLSARSARLAWQVLQESIHNMINGINHL